MAVFDELFDAVLRRRDAQAAIRLFAADPDIVMWGSDEAEKATGAAEIAALHRAIAGSTTTLEFRWHERQTRTEGDVAWVNAAADVTVGPPGEGRRTTPYRLTAVFVRRQGQWRWHTFNGSEPNRP